MKVIHWSCLLTLLTASNFVFASAQTRQQENNAKQHFKIAERLDGWNDPRAEQEYLLAIKDTGGNHPKAWSNLAQIFWKQLRFSEAIEALKKSIAQTPLNERSDDYDKQAQIDDYKILANLQRALIIQRRIDVALTPALNDLLEFMPLAGLYTNAEKLVPYAEKAIAFYPGSSKAYLLLAHYIPSDQKAQRTELLRKAVELDPANPEVHTELSTHYFLPLLNYSESIIEARKALELSNGEYAPAWRQLGYSLAASGMKQEAAAAFRNYLRACNPPLQMDANVPRMITRLENGLNSP